MYIDGFNFYFGLREKGWKRYYWLNLQELAKNLLKPFQEHVTTKYFTSRISFPPDKQKRQLTFIEALETLDNFQIFYGTYQTNTITCKRCGNIFPKPNEKMTDVNIATELLTDAFLNHYDKAILILRQLNSVSILHFGMIKEATDFFFIALSSAHMTFQTSY